MASQITKRIKIGTKVTARLFGGRMVTGVVDSIEKCKIGEKYGKPVFYSDNGKGYVEIDYNELNSMIENEREYHYGKSDN
jgi:hypothetical protein